MYKYLPVTLFINSELFVHPMNFCMKSNSVVDISKFGFSHVGQQIDEEDGPEEIFEMSVGDFQLRLKNGFTANNRS